MTRPPSDPNSTARAKYPDVPDADWQSLVDYLSGEGTPSERTLVQQRLATDSHFATFAESVIRIWQIPLTRPPRDLDAGWAAVQRKAAALEESAIGSRWSNRWSRKQSLVTLALSAIVVMFTVRAVHKHRWPSYQYQGGTTGSTITLKDGSIVTLAPDSYLATDPGFPTRNRTLHLFGKARFAVTPNARTPFIVYVPGLGVHVLGTTFAMQADTTPQVQVDVTDGKVSLQTQDSSGHWRQLMVLTSGQAISVPLLAQWMAQAGYEVAASGVPIRKAYQIEEALRRALIRAGAAAAASQAQRDSTRR